MKETIESLQKIARYTPISISWYNEDLQKVKIVNYDGKEYVRQLNQNTMTSATTQVTAMVKVWKKINNRNMKESKSLNWKEDIGF